MKKAFTLLELLIAISIMAVLLAFAIPYISNYVSWGHRTADMRNLLVTNDAIDRSRMAWVPASASQDSIYQMQGSNYTVPNGLVQNAAVLSLLTSGGPSVDALLPNDKFLSGQASPTTLAPRYFSYGSGDAFRFYDYNSDGLVLGTFEVVTGQ